MKIFYTTNLVVKSPSKVSVKNCLLVVIGHNKRPQQTLHK